MFRPPIFANTIFQKSFNLGGLLDLFQVWDCVYRLFVLVGLWLTFLGDGQLIVPLLVLGGGELLAPVLGLGSS